MESVGEVLVPIAIGYVHVALCMGWLGFDMVEVFHRHLLVGCERGEVCLKPSCHNTSEVDHNRVVCLFCDGVWLQRVDDMVSLELLT